MQCVHTTVTVVKEVWEQVLKKLVPSLCAGIQHGGLKVHMTGKLDLSFSPLRKHPEFLEETAILLNSEWKKSLAGR